MSMTMITLPDSRSPTHPGEILDEEFLKPMSLTQREAAALESIHPVHAA